MRPGLEAAAGFDRALAADVRNLEGATVHSLGWLRPGFVYTASIHLRILRRLACGAPAPQRCRVCGAQGRGSTTRKSRTRAEGLRVGRRRPTLRRSLYVQTHKHAISEHVKLTDRGTWRRHVETGARPCLPLVRPLIQLYARLGLWPVRICRRIHPGRGRAERGGIGNSPCELRTHAVPHNQRSSKISIPHRTAASLHRIRSLVPGYLSSKSHRPPCLSSSEIISRASASEMLLSSSRRASSSD